MALCCTECDAVGGRTGTERFCGITRGDAIAVDAIATDASTGSADVTDSAFGNARAGYASAGYASTGYASTGYASTGYANAGDADRDTRAAAHGGAHEPSDRNARAHRTRRPVSRSCGNAAFSDGTVRSIRYESADRRR